MDLTEAVIGALTSDNQLVRSKAARALGMSGAVIAVPMLVRQLKDDPWVVPRRSAAIALGQIGRKPSSVPADQKSGVAGHELERIRTIAEIVAALSKELAAPHETVCESAAAALGLLGSDAGEAVPALISTFQREDSSDRLVHAITKALDRGRPLLLSASFPSLPLQNDKRVRRSLIAASPFLRASQDRAPMLLRSRPSIERPQR